jgi:hypothetical protein
VQRGSPSPPLIIPDFIEVVQFTKGTNRNYSAILATLQIISYVYITFALFWTIFMLGDKFANKL